jgi:hypothetical protein
MTFVLRLFIISVDMDNELYLVSKSVDKHVVKILSLYRLLNFNVCLLRT